MKIMDLRITLIWNNNNKKWIKHKVFKIIKLHENNTLINLLNQERENKDD